MKEYLTNGGNKLTENHPTSNTILHIEERLPVLLCAVNTVEGDFRFWWTISPNVRQTHKENPNLVRIFYMIFTLNGIYKQYNKLHEHLYTKISSLRCGQKPASKCIRLVYEMLVISGVNWCKKKKKEKKKKNKIKKQKQNKNNKKNNNKKHWSVPIGYSLFANHRSVPSFGPGFFCLNSGLTLFIQSMCTIFAITR